MKVGAVHVANLPARWRLEAELGLGEGVQAEASEAGDARDHGFAADGGELVHGQWAYHFAAVAVGDDQAGVVGQHVARTKRAQRE